MIRDEIFGIDSCEERNFKWSSSSVTGTVPLLFICLNEPTGIIFVKAYEHCSVNENDISNVSSRLLRLFRSSFRETH